MYAWQGMTRLMKTAFALPRLHVSADPAGLTPFMPCHQTCNNAKDDSNDNEMP